MRRNLKKKISRRWKTNLKKNRQGTAEGGETPEGGWSLRSAGSGLLTISQTHLTI